MPGVPLILLLIGLIIIINRFTKRALNDNHNKPLSTREMKVCTNYNSPSSSDFFVCLLYLLLFCCCFLSAQQFRANMRYINVQKQ